MTSPDTSGVAPLKSGVTTTEFWVTLLTSLIGLLTATNVISPGIADRYKGAVDAMAFLAVSLVVAGYAVARAIAKAGHQSAVAAVTVAQIREGTPPIVATSRRSRVAKNEAGYGQTGWLILVVIVSAAVAIIVFTLLGH